ncbi:esterase [Mycetocola manganoxydans]|uniref:Esterase n=1 Tax=Mycetocola manganoxydans TaxID=699879 RepID=A0A3L6ZVM6_9MICO|nr:dienelactone hydrolase family protein [Mycetocola manganoxydans]RLP71910.1 esterase [Mycetocola manganoxydans]GHD47062.1 phospholipase/carboxylesterase [Mycetocola manganoxydans]
MITHTIDEDAVLWSASGDDREGRSLLIVLHGYGSNEADLFQLAPFLPLEPVIAALRAPLVAPFPIDGWSWYPIDQPGHPEETGLAASTAAVLSWLDSLPYTPDSVGLLGFSQGGAMSIELLRAAPERFSFAVNLSGYSAINSHPGDEALAERRPPVFWGRGTLDDVIPARAIAHTTEWLPAHSRLVGRVYEGLSHAISQQELADVRAFIERQL